MTDVQERRDPSTQRVRVSTLVEICGNSTKGSVFEAQAVNVSSRGMLLRTAYLPDVGAPLVCRFEKDGGEIVVEGLVAWRREGSRGGEFGVRFTALDSGSVDALRELCSSGHGDSEAAPERVEPGGRVRLHIDGLGSPMKARIRSGKEGRVQVGSSLEFLKVGRRLEVEDLEQGARRAAQIDGVSVSIDPATRVPQLVVALKYQNVEDTTPSPVTAQASEVDPGTQVTPRVPRPAPIRIPATQVTLSERPATGAPTPEKPAEVPATANKNPAEARAAGPSASDAESMPMLRGRAAQLAVHAEAHLKSAGQALLHASTGAAHGTARWIQQTKQRLAERKGPSTTLRRTTSAAPGASFSTEKPKLRAQSPGATAKPDRQALRRQVSRIAVVTGAVSVIGIGTSALVSGTPAGAPPGSIAADAASAVLVTGVPPTVTAGPIRDANGAVTAHVPLFGPTSLTTTEPAPLGPPPGEASSEETLEMKEARSALRELAGTDQRWTDQRPQSHADSPTKPTRALPEKSGMRPEDVPTWGRGRMHLPTIHRLRLNAPGQALSGVVHPTGFTVTIPDRKVMEPAARIAKRDQRIARSRADNESSGAKVSFRFKGEIPSYRVRLRRDFVEILLSAPAEKSNQAKSKSR